jgi:hypothetical protein
MGPHLSLASSTRRRSALILGIGLAIVLLVAPAIGLAAGPSSAFGPTSKSSGPSIVTPSIVPGATVGTVGFGSATSFGLAAGSTLVWQNTASGFSVYASSGYVRAALPVPAGATLWQIDFYGYASGSTTQNFEFYAFDATSGTLPVFQTSTSSTGPGLIHSTISFASGTTLTVGREWFVNAPNATSASSAFVGAVYQYTLPTLSLVPISPTRVYDSRCTGGPLAKGATRTVSVTTAVNSSTCAAGATNVVPAGAKAIAYNLTITQTVNAGNLSIYPAGGSSSASAINWFASGQSLANAATVLISSGRQVTVAAGGTAGSQTHFLIDITGYYQ